jgi:hypothetical protein
MSEPKQIHGRLVFMKSPVSSIVLDENPSHVNNNDKKKQQKTNNTKTNVRRRTKCHFTI